MSNPAYFDDAPTSESEAWGYSEPGWYFITEDEASMYGPYDSQETAQKMLTSYGEELNNE